MANIDREYPIARYGLTTSFEEAEVPPDFCLGMRNRFINAAGGAEKRHGMVQLGDTVANSPPLDAMHEYVDASGKATLLASGNGRIYRFNDTSAWSQIYPSANGVPLDSDMALQSVQMGKKLIFVNGVDRNVFTEDTSAFSELRSILVQGQVGTTASAAQLVDADIVNWVTETDVAINDVIINLTEKQSNNEATYAIITGVSADRILHSPIALPGQGGNGLGRAAGPAATQSAGDRYQIIDTVELNIVPTDGEPDNVGTLGVGSSATGIRVSAVSDWTKTDARVGDYIYNTTRNILTAVTAITTAQLRVVGASGQTNGDSITLHKSSMPIATRAHVHFGRLYLIDARDERLIRISGPGNPQDLSTEAGTLDSTSFKFGELQPQGDAALDMASYQRFFAVAGKQNVYLFQGTDPIADTTGAAVDFSIQGLFPQGIVSEGGMISIGNDLVFVTVDGVQTASMAQDASLLNRSNISDPLKVTLRNEIRATDPSQIIAIHYPRRSWLMIKIGSQFYIFNYTPFYGFNQRQPGDPGGTLTPGFGSWSKFDGKFARQRGYIIRANGDLICCGDGGKVYRFDADVFDDDGENYVTEYKSAWHTFEEPRRTHRTKAGYYISPIFDTGANIPYTIRAEGGFAVESSDTVSVVASGGAQPIGLAVVGQSPVGGSPIQDVKFPLRWRGREARITFTTNDDDGPDILSRYALYISFHGKR